MLSFTAKFGILISEFGILIDFQNLTSREYPLLYRVPYRVPLIYRVTPTPKSTHLHLTAKTQTASFLGSPPTLGRLALPTSDHGVVGSNPAGGEILPEPKRRYISQSLSCSPFHRLEMTKIVLRGRKTLTHPSISTLGSIPCSRE